MDKKIRNMIITITSVVVLIAVLIVLALLPNNQNYTGEDQSLIINSQSQEDITSVMIVNPSDTYTVNMSNGSCSIAGFDNIPMSDKAFSTLKSDSSYIKSTQIVVEEAANLSEFGLSTPTTTATITYKDGTTTKLNIGNEAPMSAGTYVSTDNSDKVYLFDTDTLDAFSYTKLDYVDKNLVPTKDSSGSTLTLNSIILQGGNRPADVEIDVTTDSNKSTIYTVKSNGIEANGDTTAAPAVVLELKNLKADSTVKVKPTTEDLQVYGLDNPFATAKVNFSDRTVEIIVSTDRDGNYYIMNKANPVIYQIASSSQDWATATFDTLASKTIINAAMASVSKVTIATPDKSYEFDVTTTAVSDSSSTSSSGTATVTNATCNNTSVDSTNFKIFYQNILKAKVDKFTTEKPDTTKTPVMSITIEYTDSTKQTEKYNFYSFDTDTNDLLVTKNDICNSAVNASYANTIIEDCEKISQNQTIDSIS